MADAVVQAGLPDHWSGTGVSISTILEQLVRLRRAFDHRASRTRVMTLVVVGSTEGDVARAAAAMHGLGDHHPARLVVLRPEPHSRTSGIDAEIQVYATSSDDHPVFFEQIELRVRGSGCAHLDSIVEPFTLSDLPVVVWYPGALPAVSDGLLPVASTVLVDTREAGELGTLADLVELARRRPVVDLSWERLRPWRELLAGLFEGPVYRPFARGVSSIDVEGKGGPRSLLAGWLLSRLGTGRTVELHDARHVSVRLVASSHGQEATFEAVRSASERMVRAGASVVGGPAHHELLVLPDDSLAWSLSRALTHLRRDRVWEQALAVAVGLG